MLFLLISFLVSAVLCSVGLYLLNRLLPERFLADLRACVAEVRARPDEREGMAPVYGLAASLPLKGVVGELLRRYVDVLYPP